LASIGLAFCVARPDSIRIPESTSPTIFVGRVWPNRGAVGSDFYSDVNVLALLHMRNTIDDQLTSNVTPWP